MTQRQQFEANYIVKHFGDALRLEEMQYRDAIEWVTKQRFASEYIDTEMQEEWQQFQRGDRAMKVGDEVYLKVGEDKGRITFSQHENGVEVYYVNFSGSTSKHEESELILASAQEKENIPKGHPNASILMEIAKEAAINKEYWKEFEYYGNNFRWESYEDEDGLLESIGSDYELRHKPRKIRIGNYDVPEPISAWRHGNIPSVLLISYHSNGDADSALKALQELLGAKQ